MWLNQSIKHYHFPYSSYSCGSQTSVFTSCMNECYCANSMPTSPQKYSESSFLTGTQKFNFLHKHSRWSWCRYSSNYTLVNFLSNNNNSWHVLSTLSLPRALHASPHLILIAIYGIDFTIITFWNEKLSLREDRYFVLGHRAHGRQRIQTQVYVILCF